MLVLKIIENVDCGVRKKHFFRNKRACEKGNHIIRYSDKINGKIVMFLEIPETELNNEDFIKLLKSYKGRLLVPEKYYCYSFLREYIFSPKEYYKRAILSSFLNCIRNQDKTIEKIFMKNKSFYPYKEFFEIVRHLKTVILITDENSVTDRFIADCYKEYGAIVRVRGSVDFSTADAFLDLDDIDDNGKLFIFFNGKNCLLYPDEAYFRDCKEFNKLCSYEIEHKMICAAFSEI